MKKILLACLLVLLLGSGASWAEEASLYTSVARQSSGQSISGATVTVFLANTTTLATIYADVGATVLKGNPFLTDSVGNYSFFAKPGLYKIVITKPAVGSFTTDFLPIGTQSHANTHASAGVDPLNIASLAGQVTSSQITDGTIVSSDISSSAAIPESKLSLSFPTHSNVNDPTTGQKQALAGTTGAPSSSNKFVTSLDPRLSDARTPLGHGSTHQSGGWDEISVTIAQILGIHSGTDISSDLEEETHASEHQDGGNDEINVAGLSGMLADPQKVQISKGGTLIGTRSGVNFIQGNNATLTVTDNPGQGRVDVTVTGPDPSTGANVAVQEGITTVSSPINTLQFSSVGFDVVEFPTNQANVSLDMSEIVAAGDLAGDMSAPLVDGLQGRTVAATAPTNKQALTWSSTSSRWQPADPDAAKLQGNNVAVTAPTAGQALVWDGLNQWWVPGDVSTAIQILESGSSVTAKSQKINFGTGFDVAESPTGQDNITLDLSELTVSADRLKTTPIATTVPSTGQVMKFDGTNWSPGTDNSSGSMGVKNNGVSLMSATTINYLSPLVGTDQGSGQVGVGISGLTSSSVSEGSNLYWTQARFDTAFTGKTTSNLSEGSNLYFTDSRFGTSLATRTTDNLAEGSTNKYLTSTQKTQLTGGANNTLHFHSSDRDLANATGVLDATKVGTGLTDTQVSDTLTVSSAGSVDGAAIKSGTVPAARLGNARVQFRSWVINFPDTSAGTTGYSFVYFPVGAVITQIAARTRIGTCGVDVDVNGVDALSADMTATTSGASTTSIANPAINAGSWVQVELASCASNPAEVSVTMVYTVN